jgi:predicted PurR-regulated permease PerM
LNFRDHLRITVGALKNWFIAQSLDSLSVAILWFAGLRIIHVPLALVWAVLAGLFHFIPHFGPLLAVAGPAIAGGLSGGWDRLLYVFALYAVIVVVESFFLQPYIFKRTVKVPIWASILTPIVLGVLIPFWGVLLAAPLLAIVYTYRRKSAATQPHP